MRRWLGQADKLLPRLISSSQAAVATPREEVQHAIQKHVRQTLAEMLETLRARAVSGGSRGAADNPGEE